MGDATTRPPMLRDEFGHRVEIGPTGVHCPVPEHDPERVIDLHTATQVWGRDRELIADGGQCDDDTGQKTCINDGCEKPRERVITLYGGVAPVCDEHAEERLENPHAVDQTEFFKGEREEPKPEPSPNGRMQPADRKRSQEPPVDHRGGADHA